jgi:hypothetical protein
MPHLRSLFLLAAPVLAAACTAPAAEQKPSAAHAATAAPAPQAAAKPRASDDMMVCRYEREIGSNIAQKVCRPKEQPKMTDDAAREWMRQQQSNNAQNTKPGG